MSKYLTGAFVFILLLSTSLSFTSCKDEDEVAQTSEQQVMSIEAYVSGRVMGNGIPLADATVALGEVSETTDSEVFYTLAMENAGDII